jgi:hypothetical protein
MVTVFIPTGDLLTLALVWELCMLICASMYRYISLLL